ncbi:hypothetical protein HJC23_001633 [Cyclotella cryptica]|uniref:FAS1 domain-containing protein n=1 Tax=Cyclotella cryptica TaxID=29204 RepID=A0ABD3QMI9_9STRA|eukprot:CCRYP_004673-RA/>CCRYP_004673-RA protein AED:0.34 eAED:0.34 QI:0/-1/0/1/-1/1/1/0/202
MGITCHLFIACLAASSGALAFHLPRQQKLHATRCGSASDDAQEFISQNYPSAYKLLSKNNDAMKAINKSESGFTIFAANEKAFESLGDKKRSQLNDVRNEEVTEKIAAYHVIAEPVTDKMLFNSGGVITLGGQVPCERSTSGGMFGMGGKEDGGVTINGSKVVKTEEFSEDGKLCIVHEVDGLVSPQILWRYADQLRIPGSK